MTNEKAIIAKLLAKIPKSDRVLLGAGDDCAIIKACETNEDFLIKVDSVVENVHFTKKDSAEKIGRKALARALSDIAAMGGKPDYALVSIALRSAADAPFMERAYEGLIALAKEFDVAIAGGETSRHPGGIFISVTLIGTVKKDFAISRSGAKIGDAIFVSGELGGAMWGHHLDFMPRIFQGQWLSQNAKVHAMIDISDGLVTDLNHLISASKVGALIDESFLPIRKIAKVQSKKIGKSALISALCDGEDFELLFTISPNHALKMKEDWAKTFPDLQLSLIGRIEEKRGLRLRQKGKMTCLKTLDGFDHFS